tara:strand:- start:944 stop:1120 length:177 start_codon:yes stop_codon:yes gene_type:complete
MNIDPETKREALIFLQTMMDNPDVHMFETPPYLTELYGINRHDAKDLMFEFLEANRES